MNSDTRTQSMDVDPVADMPEKSDVLKEDDQDLFSVDSSDDKADLRRSKVEENTGRWTTEERRLFQQGLEQHGKAWTKIASLIKSRTADQVRSHAQKYFQKTTPKLMERNKCFAEGCNVNTNLRPCTGCNFAQYCSRSCQLIDWNRHKEHCRKFGNTSDPTSQPEVVKRDSKPKKRKLKAGANSATALSAEVFEAATADAAQMRADILRAAHAEAVQMSEAATVDAAQMRENILKAAYKAAHTEAAQMREDILNAARVAAHTEAAQMREDILNAAHAEAAAAAEAILLGENYLRAAHAEAIQMRENYLRAAHAEAIEEGARLRENILNSASVDAIYERKRKKVQHLKDHAKEKLQEKREELLKEVADQCPIPPNDLPSIQEMNSDFVRFCKDKEKLGEIIQEIETCYFPSLLHQMKNMFFHICICDINLMQKYGDEEVVIPYALFDVAHSQLPHVGHLPDLQTLFANLRGDSAELWSWWIPEDFLDCVVFGLNHAFNRGYLTRNLKGKSVHIHCSYSMRQGHDVYHAPYGLPTVQRFRVCPKAVYPDFVLKITFGANGFFDPATQIHLVRIEGMACNIRIR
ncbi:protein MYSM1 [Chaetoceros tenuissimus]|uniref:Protein MYSM1 n=1 Tax=Chaetoceros tenuissimus TaxID=426638 RepID=A0AAD3CVX9_9STRA|nr:protein MYSM1 [Chaetoceros tenuissimus]